MWIDRVVTASPTGPEETELHERLTVISSADSTRRRQAYNRVLAALNVAPGTTIHARTEFGDTVTARRDAQGNHELFDSNNRMPIRSDERSLGVIAQLNDAREMAGYMELFHATPEGLRHRATMDAELVKLARTPLNQLFSLASKITADETALNATRNKRTDLSESIRERESREQSLSDKLAVQSEGRKHVSVLTYASFGLVVAGLGLAFGLNMQLPGGVLCMVGLVAAAFGHSKNKGDKLEDDLEGAALDIQLGRVGELFDTHDLTQSRRAAEESLAKSRAEWRSIAGTAKPSALLTDRPQIEELAKHLQLIENENVEPGDTTLLIGFASLLAELNRRFPAERVPLMIDDLYSLIPRQYFGVLSELILRASHRRQVVLEAADISVAKWAAVEAVGGDAMLITDHEIDVEPIIQRAVATPENGTV